MYDYKKDLENIISQVRLYNHNLTDIDIDRIEKAFWLSKSAHTKQKRKSGEPFFNHLVASTQILLSIYPDVPTICACLLHEIIEETELNESEIAKNCGEEVLKLCQRIAQTARVKLRKNQKNAEFENHQKLFIAIAKDIRVVFIKLADRIHNLQTLEYIPKSKQRRIARESLEIFSKIADKLGLFDFKERIEDLSFKYLDPKAYENLVFQLEQGKNSQEVFLKEVKESLDSVFEKESVEILSIKGRQKSLFSVYEKMKRKNLTTVSEIYDLWAFRVLVKNIKDCYLVLGAVHTHFKPISGRFKDYISIPKPNGYQSLHTTVLGLSKNKLPTEIQIKTTNMHLDAEFGPAAHWAYKENKSSNFDENYIEKIQWFDKNLTDQFKNENTAEFFEEVTSSIFDHQIYVMTPKGDMKILSEGATPIDFAYSIHSNVGHGCISAKVNGIPRPLNYKLKNEDMIEIITQKGRLPNPLWLNFIQSTSAKNKIKNILREKGVLGKPIEKPLSFVPKPINKIFRKTKKKEKGYILIGGHLDTPYRVAKCCQKKLSTFWEKPLIAFKGRGLSFQLHHQNCDNLKELNSERFMEAAFFQSFLIEIKTNQKSIDIFPECHKIFREDGISIGYMEKENRQNQTFWKFKIDVSSTQHIEEIVNKISKINGIEELYYFLDIDA